MDLSNPGLNQHILDSCIGKQVLYLTSFTWRALSYLSPTRRRAPGALRPLRSGPRPVAEQSGLLGFYCTFLLEVPVALSGRCGWTSTQPSTPTALDLGRVSPGPQDCPKTSSTFPSKAGPNLATVDLDGPRKKLFHSFFLFLLCHLLLTDPSILSKPKTKRNFIPLTKTTA